MVKMVAGLIWHPHYDLVDPVFGPWSRWSAGTALVVTVVPQEGRPRRTWYMLLSREGYGWVSVADLLEDTYFQVIAGDNRPVDIR